MKNREILEVLFNRLSLYELPRMISNENLGYGRCFIIDETDENFCLVLFADGEVQYLPKKEVYWNGND